MTNDWFADMTIPRAIYTNPWYALGSVAGARIKEAGGEPHEPLSGEWAGYSIPEIFGSWEEATEEAMEAYEAGYWSVFE